MFRGLLSIVVLAVFPAVAVAQQPCTTDARHVVDELYRHMLERSADPASAGWVEKLQNGATVREIVRQIATSPEHMQRFYNPAEGAAANERAVGTLYRHLLGRQPDAAGARAWADTAAKNGLGAVVDAILNSAEYNQAFGDWGVPGSGGIVYCGRGSSTQSSVIGTSGVANPQMRFADLDRNHDGVIARSEWRGSPRSFAIHDWNSDGVLSGDEVRVGATPPDDSVEARDFSMPTNDRFSYLDVNNNGTVDRNEWDGSLDAFYRLDRNNDGRLTRAEMGAIQTSTPFATMDTNGDGRISLGEWPYSHRSFDTQDANGDGVISREEFNINALPANAR
jgi:Ca2+-binding EF-hand superfamily protein